MHASALLAGAIFLAVLLAGAIAAYTLVGWWIHGHGGKVRVASIGHPDLILGGMIVAGLLALLAGAAGRETGEITTAAVILGIGMFGFIAALIAACLRLRGIRLREFFGLRTVSPLLAGGAALGLMAAAYPLIATAGILAAMHLGPEAQPQDLILFFKNALARRDFGQIAAVAFGAAICAPVIEEIIFRGYLYPVVKRWAGMIPAMLASAALFAAIHNNVFALGPIFVLALCLTAAYEATGSLLVPIAMHAIFNSTSLLLLLFFQPA